MDLTKILTLQNIKLMSVDIVHDYDVCKEYIFEADDQDFECAGDEVLVESSPPASPEMAAQLAAPAQGAGGGAGGGASPGAVRELIVIPELPNTLHLQHAIQQVSTASVVEVNGDSSGHSSPNSEAQHAYITVSSEGSNGVNYHVQYVEPQEIYAQGHQPHMETLRTYPVYSVTGVGVDVGVVQEGADEAGAGASAGAEAEAGAWSGEFTFAAGEPTSPAHGHAHAHAPARMPPATVQWLLDHYETAEGVSLPRSTLYAHYLRHCSAHRLEPVNAASFGKLIRSVFIGLRTRRLGTRGNSKYHYYGIRAKPTAPQDPPAPDHVSAAAPAAASDNVQLKNDTEPQMETRAQSPVGLAGIAHRQYLGVVSAPDPPPLQLTDLPEGVSAEAVEALRDHHREWGAEFLSAAASLEAGRAEAARRGFWRRGRGALCRRALHALCARADAARWLRAADLRLYQRAVELLLPDVLRPIPSQLTQAIRNFAKSLEGALAAAATAGGAPPAAARAQAAAAAALAAALRRYTSLNHLAQAARAVLANSLQIQQMVADLNRVDFRVVREQAAWACACGAAPAARRLEADFKATLGRGASLEQWAAWLEACVAAALAPHERRADYTARARRLLLDWSFYSSLVIRELTLRSAASFGSFHLLRLLYDEYVAFLLERRVAQATRSPPIAVMQRALDDDDDLTEEATPGEGSEMDEGACDGGELGELGGEMEEVRVEVGDVGEVGELGVEVEGEEQEWEWADEEEDEDEPLESKKPKLEE